MSAASTTASTAAEQPVQQAAQDSAPGPARLIFTLGLAGLLSGLVLVGVYEATMPTIKKNQAAALKRAVLKVVPGSKKMQKLVLKKDKLVVAEKGEDEETEGIFAAYDASGNFVGYAIPNEGNGFADVIKLIYGYNHEKQQVSGQEILESRETPGLGDKISKDQKFVDNFKALSVKPQIVVTKKGKTKPNEVDAITGATISSKAVVKIINTANEKWLNKLPPSGSEPPLKATTPAGQAKKE